jgi:hypothetical protein
LPGAKNLQFTHTSLKILIKLFAFKEQQYALALFNKVKETATEELRSDAPITPLMCYSTKIQCDELMEQFVSDYPQV